MKYIPAIISVLIALCGYIMYLSAKKKTSTTEDEKSIKRISRSKRIGMMLSVFGIWMFIGSVITLVFGNPSSEKFTANVIPPRTTFNIFGYQPSETMIVGWGVMAALIIGAIILRIVFVPKLTDVPGKFQNAIETIIETVENYSSGKTTDIGRNMFGYIFAVGATLMGNTIAELMGFRSPSSDLMFTLALSIFAFIMANWYGIRKLSLRGRLKSIASPSPILIPIRLVTDLANPLSMACRLFGNTLSGMIIMNLIYSVLGNFGAGIPSVAGLYFNVFSASIQMVIFITLTLSNINETTTKPST